MTPEVERRAVAPSGVAPEVGAAGPDASLPPDALGPQTPVASVHPRADATGQTAVPGLSGEGEPGTVPPRVIGIDLSLSSTGLADSNWSGMRLDSIRTGPGDHLTDQHDRLRHIVAEIINRTSAGFWSGPDLAVIEGPSYNSSGAGTWDRAGLWWLTVDRLLDEAVPVAVVPPKTLKKYATGNGNASKPDMRMALYRRAGIDERDDNKVDAWFLAAMGLDHLGHPPVEMPKAHREALAKVRWPEVSR